MPQTKAGACLVCYRKDKEAVQQVQSEQRESQVSGGWRGYRGQIMQVTEGVSLALLRGKGEQGFEQRSDRVCVTF